MTELTRYKDTRTTCFANVRMDNGDPCYIRVAQTGVLVKKSRLGLLGAKLYEEKRLRQAATTAKALAHLFPDPLTPTDMTNPVLKAFVNAVLHCSTLEEVTRALNEPVIDAEKNGIHPISEAQGAPPPLDSDARTEDAAHIEPIVRDFRGLVEKIDPLSLYDASVLPHPKDEILRALLVAIRLGADGHEREQLNAALSFLACFQEDVGPDPISLRLVDLQALSQRMQSGEITDIESAHEMLKASSGVDQEKYDLLQESYIEDIKRFRALARALSQ